MAAGIIQFMENDAKQLLYYKCLYVSADTDWQPSCDQHIPYSQLTSSCDCEKSNCQTYYEANDKRGEPGSVRCIKLTFLDAFYYILVTAATIGYGDIVPTSEEARAVVIFIIFTTMTVIPVQVNTLTTLLSMTSQYRQAFNKQNDIHVVVCGYVQDYRRLKIMLKELLHPDRSNNAGTGDDDLHVVVLSPLEPSEDIKSLLLLNQFDGRVSYLVGSALSVTDLQRVRVNDAAGIFFLCNPEIHESISKLDDAANVLRTLSVGNFNSRIGCYVEILKSEDREVLRDMDLDFVLCLDELKTAVQARNCMVPGLSTLVENLFHTFGASLKEQAGGLCYLSNKAPWLQAYIKGASKECYSLPLYLAFVEACSFEWSLIVEGIYLAHDCIVIGAYSSQTGAVLLNPCRHDMKKYRYASKFFEYYDAVIVIADERSQATRMEEGMQDRATIAKTLKKLCVAEDFFAVRRALPSNSKDGMRQARNKITMREITRITKGLAKQRPVDEEEEKAKQDEKGGKAGSRHDTFLGFSDRGHMWNKIRSGAMKATNLLTHSGAGASRLGIAAEIIKRRQTGLWQDDEEMLGESFDPDDDDEAKDGGNRRARSPPAGGGDRRRGTNDADSAFQPSRQSRISRVTSTDLEQSMIDDASDIHHHIVVFGSMLNLWQFVQEFRRPVVSKLHMHPIVVVAVEQPSRWDLIVEEFSDVYFLQGDFSSSITFNKSNVREAHGIVLLSGRENVTKVEEEYLDADTLFMYMKLEKHIPKHIFFSVELTCASNMAVLNASAVRKAAVKGGPVAAPASGSSTAGAANEYKPKVKFDERETTTENGTFSNHKTLVVTAPQQQQQSLPAILELDTAKTDLSVDKPGAEHQQEQLLYIEPPLVPLSSVPISDDTFWTMDDSVNVLPVFASGNAYVPNTIDSLLVMSFYDTFVPRLSEMLICGTDVQTLMQVPMPPSMIGFFFVDIFRTFASRSMLILALYRGPSTADGNVLPYVITAPPPETILRENDKLFIFGIPKDIEECLSQLGTITINDRETSLIMPLAGLLQQAADANAAAAAAASHSSAFSGMGSLPLPKTNSSFRTTPSEKKTQPSVVVLKASAPASTAATNTSEASEASL